CEKEQNAKDDSVDIDALAAEIEGAGASKETKGKKKKKGAKKDDFEYDSASQRFGVTLYNRFYRKTAVGHKKPAVYQKNTIYDNDTSIYP
uniref:Uncharacterized protein n=1 Tax=Sphaeramia orbicularis TaxID=375764 RepID=A0A672Z511_9TELE